MPTATNWLQSLLKIGAAENGDTVTLGDARFVMHDGILRSEAAFSAAQEQTKEAFGFKWKRRESFTSPAVEEQGRKWLLERYGDFSDIIRHYDNPVVIDAGCGAAYSALLYFREHLTRMRYLGVDISTAVDEAKSRFAEAGLPGKFIQCHLNSIPLPLRSADVIFSEGVLHHTDSTRHAFGSLVPLLKKGGRFMLYVYRVKGPIREFTDDYIRDQLQKIPPQEGWDAMLPLSKLGKLLGDLNIEVDIPEDIDLLDIPAGKHNLQRLFYWHIFKAFYNPDMTIDEMNLINYDWYAPRNAHRHTIEEVRAWCASANLTIEREVVEPAGITVIAVKE